LKPAALKSLGLVMLLALLGASGCARLKPWERGKLAHETMLLGEDARPGESHVYAIQEGAVGGGAAVEGGCGCN
jgi:hypothetical protein